MIGDYHVTPDDDADGVGDDDIDDGGSKRISNQFATIIDSKTTTFPQSKTVIGEVVEILGPVLDDWATQPQLATATLGSLGKESAGGRVLQVLLCLAGFLSPKLRDHEALNPVPTTSCSKLN